MKSLLVAIPLIGLFMIGGCAHNASPAAQKETRPALEATAPEAKPEPVLTAEDLKIQTKSAPLKKYNGLSLGEARRAQSAAQRGQSNSAGTIKSGSAYQSRNPI